MSKPDIEDTSYEGIKKMNDSLRWLKTSRDLCSSNNFSIKSHSAPLALHFLCFFFWVGFQLQHYFHEGLASKGPIFEDGPNFEMAFKLFLGNDGAMPRSEKAVLASASISLAFFTSRKKTNSELSKKESSSQGGPSEPEALPYGLLRTGHCLIAKSCRVVSSGLPLVAKVLKRPAGPKLKCPPAVVATQAAISETASGENPEPQPFGGKTFVIGMLGLAANAPLGIWREQAERFSPSWFAAVLSAVPVIAMLGKSIVMSMPDIVLTIGASVLGQVIGSMAERNRLKTVAAKGRHLSETRTTSSSKEWALQVSSGISISPETCRKISFDGLVNSAKSHSCTESFSQICGSGA